MEQCGWMKLVELKIGNTTPGAPGHGDTITRGNVRVGGVLIYFGGATCCQHHGFRLTGFDLFFVTIPDPGPHHPARARQANLVRNNQVNGITALKHPNIRMAERLADQGGFHRFTGGICSVQDPAMAVSAFAGKVVTLFAVWLNLSIKQYTLVNKPLDAVTRIAGDKFRSMFIDDPGSGNQRIFDV